ncbi:MAG: hypothetical protein EPN21_16145 [Methylococcaceae bacterium]|nr:MAG: hypothetical protein EPN21_16145 [Methylococcaceae bacterium]
MKLKSGFITVILISHIMKIPVFVSSSTVLSQNQEKSREKLLELLDKFNLEPRALGRSDYPTEYPLREVYVIAKHCAGGIILGFEQIRATCGLIKPSTPDEKQISEISPVSIPTPWNHLEAGIIFGLHLPLLIFRQEGVFGGVFDNGVTDVFVHTIPVETWMPSDEVSLNAIFLKWHAKVIAHYYM